MLKNILIAGVTVATFATFFADHADAFGGRGYARRQARRAHYIPAPVVVHRVHTVPVARYHSAPVVTYYRAPVFHQPPVTVHVEPYNSYYVPSYPVYGGVSVGIGR